MKKLVLPLVLGAFVLGSCSKDSGDTGSGTVGEPREININLVNDSNPTRAFDGTVIGEGDENKITILEFFVFNAAGTKLDEETGNGFGYVRMEADPNDVLDLNHRIRVTSEDNKKFIVVANSDIGEPTSVNTTYESILKEVTEHSYPSIPGSNDNPRVIRKPGFEMSGTAVASVGEGSANNVYITLLRTVSRVDQPKFANDIKVELSQQEQIDEIWGEGSGVDTNTEITFTYKGHAVVNGATKSDISFVGNSIYYYKDPEGSPWEDWTRKGNIKSDFNAQGYYENNYSGKNKAGDSWFITDADTDGAVYVYENMPEEKNTPGMDGFKPSTVYAYIIEGVLTPDAASGELPATRYWRVDLSKDQIYHVMRNCVYKVTINKITTPGYNTPKEAEDEERPVPLPGDTTTDFVISIAQWDINKYETDM